jgi:D-inositol-3-phosphate glycosyltransferase
MLVVHSNPVVEPGVGDAGGMTVYVRQMARSLAARGLDVDIYTRRDSAETPDVTNLFPGVVVRQIPAGAPGLSKGEIPAYLPEFTANLLHEVGARGLHYDLIHSHYWLSGRVASILSARWGIPFVHTFHTLGRVKNEGRANGEPVEPDCRLRGEARVIAEANAIVASAPDEREWLIDLYAAHPERIHVIPPGVDHSTFRPGDREAAKAALDLPGALPGALPGGIWGGLSGKRVLLFVGRLQPLKGADTAIEALGHLVAWGRLRKEEAVLVIVGGASGVAGASEPARLRRLAEDLGLGDVVRFVTAQPQSELPNYYQAADVCLVPSHAESFGLVALEAQACGTPVVAAGVGGLRSIVRHGQTGFLVQPGASAAFAERVWRILSDQPLATNMGRLAVCSSSDFSWERSADELCDLYTQSARDFAEASAKPLGGLVAGAGRNFTGREEISSHTLDAPGVG